MTFGTAYDQVSTWDSAASSWKHWVNDSDFNDFTQFEYGKTYEIYNKTGSDKSLTVTGKTTALDITHSIVSGDNFISPAVKSATNVSTVLGSLALGTDFSDIKRFNATTQTWESYASSQFTQFEPGKGYNIVGLRSSNFSYGKTETTTTFVYDSTGARVKKTAADTTTIYLGKDYDIVGALSTKYIFLGDRRVALKDSSGTKLFFHEDHINSSNIITDASGDQAAMYEYDPYGATVTQTGSAEVKHRFTGQEADDSTGLYYYGARYYDSQLGRFITADPTIQHPADPQDFNRYAYARNNPIRFTDPTGLGWLSKLFAAVFAVVAVVATWGAATPAIIAAATIAGALGGVAGATIEKSNLLRGALEGAAIGAAIGTGASALQGASGGGGGQIVGSKVTWETTTTLTQAGEMVVKTVPTITPIVSESSSPLIANIVGATLAFAGQSASQQMPETRRPREVQENMSHSGEVAYRLSPDAVDKILRKTESLNGNILPQSNVSAGGGFPGRGGQGALTADVLTTSQTLAGPLPIDGLQARSIGKWIATTIRMIVAAAGILSGNPEEEPESATYKNLKNKTTVEEIYDKKKRK